MADAALKRREYALAARYTMLAQELVQNAMRARSACKSDANVPP